MIVLFVCWTGDASDNFEHIPQLFKQGQSFYILKKLHGNRGRENGIHTKAHCRLR